MKAGEVYTNILNSPHIDTIGEGFEILSVDLVRNKVTYNYYHYKEESIIIKEYKYEAFISSMILWLDQFKLPYYL